MVRNLRHPDDLSLGRIPGSNAALPETVQNGNCILITGPNLLVYTHKEYHKQHSPYLMLVLYEMTEWCIEQGIIKDPREIKELRTLVKRKAEIPLAWRIVEHFSDESEQHLCIKDVVLQNHALTQNFYQFLTRYSFLGYIATTYDTFIEEIYQAKWQSELARFYTNSIQGAVAACRAKQPFILKLFGDIENEGSISIRRRATKGVASVENLDLLRQIRNDLPVVFLGFDQTGEDFKKLKDVLGERELICYNLPLITEPEIEDHPLEIEFSVKRKRLGKSRGDPSTARQDGTGINSSQVEQARKKSSKPPDTLEIFLSFVSNDKKYKEDIEIYLKVLQRQYKQKHGLNIIITNNDNIGFGMDWKAEIQRLLAKADIILLLVSIHFLYSEFCAEIEMEQAIKRHNAGKARVIPIILEACSWYNEAFCNLKPLPAEGKPVDSWGKKARAFANIALGVEQAIKELTGYS